MCVRAITSKDFEVAKNVAHSMREKCNIDMNVHTIRRVLNNAWLKLHAKEKK
jgi:hypothetical protein